MCFGDSIRRFLFPRRIPYVQQLMATDCGAACLAMVLRYHGRQAPLPELRTALVTGRDGSSARRIVEVARTYGMVGTVVPVDLKTVGSLPIGSVLHWEFSHFVVLERVTSDGILIVDPASGRRHITNTEVCRSLTGVAVALVPVPDFKLRGGEVPSILGHYARPLLRHLPLLVRIAFTSLAVAILSMAMPILLAALMDRIIPARDVELIYVLGPAMLIILLMHFAGSVCRAELLLYLRSDLDMSLTRGFLDHLVALPYEFFGNRTRGDLVQRMNANGEVREILTSTALSTILDGLFVTTHLAVLFNISPVTAGIAVVFGCLQIGVFLFGRGPQRRLTSQYLLAQARCQDQQIDLLTGIEALKSMGCERRAVDRWSALFVQALNVNIRRSRLTSVIDSILGSLRVGAPLCIVWFGALQVVNDQLSIGSMLASVSLSVGFLTPLSALLSTAMRFVVLSSYLDRISDVLSTPREPADGRRLAKLVGCIRLENVSFTYDPLGQAVLKEISFDASPGQFIGIVGPSGAGKSTLVRLLAGLHNPTSGRIYYDGVPLAELNLQWLRGQLGVVSQIPQLFGLTIRDNITFGDPFTPFAEIERAAKLARLHDDIIAMPLQYDTVVTDGGAAFSGGQRQRISLARAVLRHPAVLILDEATSSLDTRTEAAVRAELAGLSCTRIVIAHRLSTVSEADQILVVDDGRIVARGTHRELLTESTHYRELWIAQGSRRVSDGNAEVENAE